MSLTIRSLHIYPIKSCGGIDLESSPIGQEGLHLDRRWMLITPDGLFMTQRTLPKMALIRPSIHEGQLVIEAPGMPPLLLLLPEHAVEADNDEMCKVTVWRDTVLARSEGAAAAHWFSRFLNIDCRLVRVDHRTERYASKERIDGWLLGNPDDAAGFDRQQRYGFADGFPLLIANQASLDELNSLLLQQGRAPVPMNRFRPNIVVDGLDAYEEDFATLIETEGVRMALVKPCTRCGIPNIDQSDASVHDEPGISLVRSRSFDAGVIFGQNAIVAADRDACLHVGATARASMNF